MAAVCRTCEHRGAAFNKWALPPGVAFLVNRSCVPASELGQNHARLPVTHTKVGASLGLWFYYARGCSDLTWDVGRTLFSLNRLSLLVELVQRHGAAVGAALDEGAALARAAALVRRIAPRAAAHALLRARSRHNPRYNAWFRAAHGGNQSDVQLEWLIREGARGLFVDGDWRRRALGRIGTAPCSLTRSQCTGQCAVRAMLLSRVWKLDPLLDAVNAHVLARLHELAAMDGRVAGIDTVQLWQAGFRDRPGNGVPTELWDVRYLQAPKSSRASACTDGGCAHAPPHFGRLDGSPCELDRGTPRCWACNNSRLSRACRGTTPTDPIHLRC